MSGNTHWSIHDKEHAEEIARLKKLNLQAAEHIEKQQTLLDQQETIMKELHARLEKEEHSKEELMKWWHAERDDAERLRKENEQLLESNCRLEAQIEIMGG